MLDAIHVSNDQALLALRIFTEGHRARDLSKHAGIFWRTGLEEFSNTWQTAGNVAGLLGLLRNPRQHFANSNLLAVTNRDQGAYREGDVHAVVGAGDLHLLAFRIDQFHLRPHALDLGTPTALGIDHHQGRKPGDFIDLLGDGHAFFDVFELHTAAVLADDRTCQRIPGRQQRSGLH